MLIQNNYKPAIVRDQNSKPNFNYGRIHLIILILFILFFILIFHLVNMDKNDFWKQQANNVSLRNIPILAHRGKILDRNGNILAMDQAVKNVIIDTHKLPNFDEQRRKNPKLRSKINQDEQNFYLKLEKLAIILHVPKNIIFKKFDYKSYVNKIHGDIYLKRRLGKKISSKIELLNIQGLKMTSSFIRRYPENKLFSQIIGITKQDLDTNTNREKIIGLEGIEYYYNDLLEGHNGLKVMFKDNKERFVKEKNTSKNKSPIDGKDIVLSLDKNIQKVVYDYLSKSVITNKADNGSVVVLDAKNGEILAMVSYPEYDPEHFNKYKPETRKNKAVVDLIEPGSIIKPFIISAALEQNIIKPTDLLDTNPYNVGSHKIKDVHNYYTLDVTGVITKSSNVGISLIGLKLSSKDLYYYLTRFGFGAKTGAGFPGESNPILKNWRKWSELDQAVLSYGYGIQTNLLQLARAYTIFTNKGQLLPVTFFKTQQSVTGISAISVKTANEVKKMLLSVTKTGGTGVKAAIDGYKVAGKTGTVEKNINRRYQKNRHISLFVGFAPLDNPNVIVAVSIDNPKKNGHYGGEIAAPVFSNIMSKTLNIRGINPITN